LPHDKPKAGALLLHGLSDSPYSLRNVAQKLHKQGYYVVGLRMPGHGTIPSGLVHASWQDMAAAVKLAARHLKQRLGPNKKMHIIGYSMGAAQAVNYALDSLQDRSLSRVESLILISPAIGVSSVAALAIWQSRLSSIPGLEKLAWNSIGPEYDPYKYNSFAVNAGDLMYRLTLTISNKLDQLEEQQRSNEFPNTQIFISAVDATVSTSAVIRHLLSRVDNKGNELIVFDINRNNSVLPFIQIDPGAALDKLLQEKTLNFRFSLLTNESPDSLVLEEKNRERDKPLHTRKLNISWPSTIYSLSHIALPFPPSDSLYGGLPDDLYKLHIGLVSPRGEKGVLSIHPSDTQRLRYNPFFNYLQQRIEAFLL
jgi:alpha-beta hydrolase superfamily lysophospholipase